ncbi:hypothetical protein ACYZT9_19935 [Pseudomonas sp. ZT5P21]
MSIKQGFPVSARKKREQYLAYRQSIRVIDMAAPTPGAANPFLDPLVAGGPSYLPYSYFNKSLVFMLPVFDGQADTTPSFVEAFLTVDGSPDATSKYEGVTPLDPLPPIPMTLRLASKDLPGMRTISFAFEFQGNPANVGTFRYEVDPVPPLLDKSVEPPQSAIDEGLDPDDFVGGKTVKLTYAVWSNQRLGDEIKCYIGRDKNTKQEVGSITIDASNLGRPIEFSLEARHVVGFDGRYIVFCEARSYPGVPSLPSAEKVLYVFKDLKPIVAEPLNVPQIPDPALDMIGVQELIDGLGAGLKNQIPNFNSSLDKIVYTIDGVEQPEKPITQIPFLHDLDNHALVAKGHFRNDLELGYRVKRGIFFYPAQPIVTNYSLDTRKPCAPFDPADANPPDKTMLLPWIKGPVSEANKLTAADKQNGGVVKGFIPYHPLFKVGDSAQFYIGGIEVPPPGGIFNPSASDDKTKPAEFTMDWTFLGTIPDNKTTQLQVVVTHDVNFNEAISTVDYADVSTQPIILAAAGFKYMHANPLIGLNCSSLRKLPNGEVVLVINIPADTRLAGNDVVVKYEGYAANTPGTPIPGSEWEDEPYAPTPAEAAAGYERYMPYTHMLATLNGYGRVSYEVTINREFVAKDGDVVRISAYNGTETCDVTKPIIPV